MNGRILFIFTFKSLIYTVIGAIIGLIAYALFSLLALKVVGIVLLIVFALLGFAIGAAKIPEISGLKFTKKVGGENIDEIIKRAIKFRAKRKKIYVYVKEENK